MKNFTKLAVIASMLIIVFSMNAFSQINVTLRVDMQEETVSPDSVHVAGSFQGWDPAGTVLIPFIGDVWEVTFQANPGEQLFYKFINGNDWPFQETVPAACGEDDGYGGYNRVLDVENGDTILPAVCFGSCLPCVLPEVDITFSVDMQNETVAGGVFLSGDFNGWNTTANPMINTYDYVYEVTITLEAGNYYEYKFVNGANYESIPGGSICVTGGYNNRYLTAPSDDTALDLVCFGSCDPCTSSTDINVTFQVDMSEADSISSAGIHIVGDFQGWNPAATEMTDMGGGIYAYTTILQSGSYHEYKFVNDTTWDGAEDVPWFCNNGGNRVLNLLENDTILPAFCFSSCLVCNPPPVDVTFQVDMSLQFVAPEGVHLMGTFNNWDTVATPMADMGSNLWIVTVTLGEGEFHEYKFINGNTYAGAENVPPECANYGGNREFFVPDVNTILPHDCFSGCGPCQATLYTFNLSVMLEGAINGTDMKTDLWDAGVLPIDQPFNTAPWNYDGQQQITAPPEADIVDWLYIQMRETSGDASTAIPDSLIDHQCAVLLADGTVASPDGNPNIYYTGNITKDLYIVIYSRNHLAVMSATPLVDIFGTYAYDFTTGLSQAYLDGHKLLGGGIYGMIGGDSDGNGTVNNDDKDVNWTNDAGNAGYYGSDLNMDTQVNNPDKNDLWEPNLDEESQVPFVPAFNSCGDLLWDERDLQSYTTVQIGTQCWMAENLNIGTRINSIDGGTNNDGEQSNNGTIEKYCYDDNEIICNTYGGIYKWAEMVQYLNGASDTSNWDPVPTSDVIGICPSGWHLPSDAEWTVLTTFLGGDSVAGGKMKETGTVHWLAPNTGATNSSGFTALPAGMCAGYGNRYFANLNYYETIWSSTMSGTLSAWSRHLYWTDDEVVRSPGDILIGISARCLKD